MPPDAYVKEEQVAPPLPPGAVLKEEGVVPPMPPDAIIKCEPRYGEPLVAGFVGGAMITAPEAKQIAERVCKHRGQPVHPRRVVAALLFSNGVGQRTALRMVGLSTGSKGRLPELANRISKLRTPAVVTPSTPERLYSTVERLYSTVDADDGEVASVLRTLARASASQPGLTMC